MIMIVMHRYISLLFLFFLFSCNPTPTLVPQSYDPPGATDTRDKEIVFQARAQFSFAEDGVFFSNDFEGGRLVDVRRTAPGEYAGVIMPENLPINNSAWYAFNAWSMQKQTINLTLHYRGGAHRYWPKWSWDKTHWTPLDSSQVEVAGDKITAKFELEIGKDTLWVAGQELLTSYHSGAWRDRLAQKAFINSRVIGTSREGRPIHALEFSETSSPEAYILVIGRQHPPEIAGALALMPFVEYLASDTELAKSFRSRYAVWVVPVVNPDGVAEGHWRHNTGGVDLNRDWYGFNQPETRAVRDYFLQLKEDNKAVFAAFDFHATRYDIMYTLDRDLLEGNDFTDAWLDGIRAELPEYTLTDEPGGLGSPISKVWFYETFQAPAFTYEVGDETERALINVVASTAAKQLMVLALEQ